MRIACVLTFLVGTFGFLFFLFTLQTKINTPLMPCISVNLNCTINLTVTYFLPALTHKLVKNRKHILPCFFSNLYGLSFPDMGLTQIPGCWLVTTSPGAGIPSIALCLLANWNMWPFIIEKGLISIPGQLKVMCTCHVKLCLNFHSDWGNIWMITPLLRSLWLMINVFI